VDDLERGIELLPHTHTALADAREQAAIFRQVLDGA
jgi:exonuclease VII small subunit